MVFYRRIGDGAKSWGPNNDKFHFDCVWRIGQLLQIRLKYEHCLDNWDDTCISGSLADYLPKKCVIGYFLSFHDNLSNT